MDYGTPTVLPWGIIHENQSSFAPVDGVSRHPDQFYELLGDVMIAAVLIEIRRKLPEGAAFFLNLVLFSVLRFCLFFVRGNVPEVLLGLKNGQWTALVILVVAVPTLLVRGSRRSASNVGRDLSYGRRSDFDDLRARSNQEQSQSVPGSMRVPIRIPRASSRNRWDP
jgi:prolipoprotein diacylglyceryltransferase